MISEKVLWQPIRKVNIDTLTYSAYSYVCLTTGLAGVLVIKSDGGQMDNNYLGVT